MAVNLRYAEPWSARSGVHHSSSGDSMEQLQQSAAALQLLQFLQEARAQIEQQHLPAQIAQLVPYLRHLSYLQSLPRPQGPFHERMTGCIASTPLAHLLAAALHPPGPEAEDNSRFVSRHLSGRGRKPLQRSPTMATEGQASCGTAPSQLVTHRCLDTARRLSSGRRPFASGAHTDPGGADTAGEVVSPESSAVVGVCHRDEEAAAETEDCAETEDDWLERVLEPETGGCFDADGTVEAEAGQRCARREGKSKSGSKRDGDGHDRSGNLNIGHIGASRKRCRAGTPPTQEIEKDPHVQERSSCKRRRGQGGAGPSPSVTFEPNSGAEARAGRGGPGPRRKSRHGKGENRRHEQAEQAKDVQSDAESDDREVFEESIKVLQELVPCGKARDPASVLDQAIDHVAFLQNQLEKLQSRRLALS